MHSSVYACLSVFKSVRVCVRAPRAWTCGRTAHACVPAYSSFVIVNTGGSKRVKHGGDYPASETLRNN